MGKLGIELVRKELRARVMISGLGLGFTLRKVLEGLSSNAQVDGRIGPESGGMES